MYDENSTPVPLSNPEDLRRAVRESNQRLGKLTDEERNALHVAALKRVFPNGYWTCKNNEHPGMLVNAASGTHCGICGNKESLLARLKRKFKF